MGRQKSLPDITKEKRIEEIEETAEAYAKAASASRMSQRKTGDLRDALIVLFEKHGIETYRAEDGNTYAVGLGKKKIIISEGEDASDEEDEASDKAAE